MAIGHSVVREYRRRAEECQFQADKAKSEDDRARWLQLAERWEHIAADAEQRRGTDEKRTQASPPTPPGRQ
jgi:hypothetical protein